MCLLDMTWLLPLRTHNSSGHLHRWSLSTSHHEWGRHQWGHAPAWVEANLGYNAETVFFKALFKMNWHFKALCCVETNFCIFITSSSLLSQWLFLMGLLRKLRQLKIKEVKEKIEKTSMLIVFLALPFPNVRSVGARDIAKVWRCSS